MASRALPVERAGIDPERVRVIVLRYGLAIILLWIGCLKFTEYEAKGIEPLAANSPFLSGAYHALGLQGVTKLPGMTEIVFRVLISLRPLNARLRAYGIPGAVVMFLTTLSLLLATPA